ncbi:peroxisome assembly protein (Peroxin-2) [Coemansia guatemalensis]|uniref:RING-type E3 ubiquitin transferase (cysteine targeting) n=1 Tax=Coemansia guatemalensis TaxID=2761395 RepID=A0A9W8HUK5_9FUNG|nr:peroxisome assembly protein (Peroxin-2) [Coemansia guatemalensis]
MDEQLRALPQSSQPWTQGWTAAKDRIATSLAHAPGAVVPRNSRVSKLDADMLDDELTSMLREPVARALSLLRPGLLERYSAEVDTVIRALLFWLSVGSPMRRATYGQSLQNLTYAHSGRGFARRIHLFGLLSIGGAYAWTRAVSAMSLRGWADAPQSSLHRRLWQMAQRLESVARIAALLNFLAFLFTGQYKSLVERFLRLRLVYARPQLSHGVSFEFLNRQLVWHAFTEFVMFALPLVNPARARAWVMRNTRRALGLSAVAVDPDVKALPEHVCAICFVGARDTVAADTSALVESAEPSSAINPYITNCGHRYCYVCIQSRMMAEADECVCLRCGEKVEHIQQFVEF